jgi:hypothetical protein
MAVAVPQVFRPQANAFARWIMLVVVVGVAFLGTGATFYLRSDFYTAVDHPIIQPVPFSHQHHVAGLGLDCRYCHTDVETSPVAGVPPTEVCMTCHSQIWTNAAVLAPVRQSFATGVPIQWNQVNRVPDYVYFNHAIHVNKGVACVTCHGQIDRMPLMMRAHPMQMEWCLNCHRDPTPNLRPPEAVFDPEWQAPQDIAALQALLVAHEKIDPATMTDCYVCHR